MNIHGTDPRAERPSEAASAVGLEAAFAHRAAGVLSDSVSPMVALRPFHCSVLIVGLALGAQEGESPMSGPPSIGHALLGFGIFVLWLWFTLWHYSKRRRKDD